MAETTAPVSKPSGATGPLSGFRIVEFAGIGPGPFAAMLLADMGAEVITLVRPNQKPKGASARGRRVITVDLKDQAAIAGVLALLDGADALLEGFRPGVMERLGLGPDVVLGRNKKLVFGRMTGWGQDGPLALAAGHDINYISITGALAAIGGKDKPVPPLNLVGDFGGGALYLVGGMLAAMLEASRSGSIGSIEPQFYAQLRELAGLTDPQFDGQMDPKNWAPLRAKLDAVFKTKTRDEWCAIMEGTDICFAPVLTMTEATKHPHMVAREVFVQHDGHTQPGPAPRFSRTPSSVREMQTAELGAQAKAWGR